MVTEKKAYYPMSTNLTLKHGSNFSLTYMYNFVHPLSGKSRAVSSSYYIKKLKCVVFYLIKYRITVFLGRSVFK